MNSIPLYYSDGSNRSSDSIPFLTIERNGIHSHTLTMEEDFIQMEDEYSSFRNRDSYSCSVLSSHPSNCIFSRVDEFNSSDCDQLSANSICISFLTLNLL